jgi:uncharacterized protein
MRFSKYNIFSRIRDSNNHFIVNLLTGNADILSQEDARKMIALKESNVNSDEDFAKELLEKGYLIGENEEIKLYRKRYLDFIDLRDEDEIQFFFVLNYTCNFACPYCYQDDYYNQNGIISEELIDAFFRYIQIEFAGRKKYITVFGGEPLLASLKQKELITYLLTKSKEFDLDVCIVTNGYTLDEYIDIIRQYRIREIQVTLDGTAEVHNARRFLKSGAATFDKIVRGIDLCLENKISINLRMVIDKENIDNLPELARFAIKKGWTQNPFFKTQLGRNYELHHCQSDSEKLLDRIALYEKIYELTKQHKDIVEFYKPAYSITKFLAGNGVLPDPLFDSCPACKTEWAFDYTGHIYPCTATVGKTGESLGTFFPSVTREIKKIVDWQLRDVTSINDCKECNLQLACGGGCGAVAKNIAGNVCSKDCRPVKELLELGFATYFND